MKQKLYRSLLHADKPRDFLRGMDEADTIRGNKFIIEEKLDGSNINFFIDWVENDLKIFSRTMDITDNLWEGLAEKVEGMRKYMADVYKYVSPKQFVRRYSVFTGEYLGKAKIKYNTTHKGMVYLFDGVHFNDLKGFLNGNTKGANFVERGLLEYVSEVTGMPMVPLLAQPLPIELVNEKLIKQIMEDYPKSRIEDCVMEGVVIKENGGSVRMKWVSDAFREIKGVKKTKPKQVGFLDINIEDYGIEKYLTKWLKHKSAHKVGIFNVPIDIWFHII